MFIVCFVCSCLTIENVWPFPCHGFLHCAFGALFDVPCITHSVSKELAAEASDPQIIYQFGKLQSLLVGDGIRAWKWNHFSGHLPRVRWCVSSTRCAFIVCRQH